MLIKVIFLGTLTVNVSVFCDRNACARGSGDIFSLKEEHVRILRACACIDTHSYAGSGMTKILSVCK